MSILRLGVYKLPAPEVAVIQTIVQLYATDMAFPWALAGEPPYDALLVDESTTADERSELADIVGVVLTLTRRNAGGQPGTMERPIRADKLQQWLRNVEDTLRAEGAGRSAMEEQAALLEVESSDSVRFKLRRWPSVLLLRNDPDKTRMAGLLARRPLNAIELAGLSKLPLSRCVTFLQTLRSAGMLKLHVVHVASADAEGDATSSRGFGLFTPVRNHLTRSLIKSIRRRLGMGTVQ